MTISFKTSVKFPTKQKKFKSGKRSKNFLKDIDLIDIK